MHHRGEPLTDLHIMACSDCLLIAPRTISPRVTPHSECTTGQPTGQFGGGVFLTEAPLFSNDSSLCKVDISQPEQFIIYTYSSREEERKEGRGRKEGRLSGLENILMQIIACLTLTVQIRKIKTYELCRITIFPAKMTEVCPEVKHIFITALFLRIYFQWMHLNLGSGSFSSFKVPWLFFIHQVQCTSQILVITCLLLIIPKECDQEDNSLLSHVARYDCLLERLVCHGAVEHRSLGWSWSLVSGSANLYKLNSGNEIFSVSSRVDQLSCRWQNC